MTPPPPDSEVNPYAPPQAEVALVSPGAQQKDVSATRRPASVKWALFLCNLHLIAPWLLAVSDFAKEQQAAAEFGTDSKLQLITPELLIKTGLFAVPLLLFNFCGRKLLGYGGGMLCLILICAYRAADIPVAVRVLEEDGELAAKIQASWFLLFNFIFAWLFYRFTFASASRTYYGVGGAPSRF